MAEQHESFVCGLDEWRPGSAAAIRQDKLIAVCRELGFKWGKWTAEEYLMLCDLAGVEPM